MGDAGSCYEVENEGAREVVIVREAVGGARWGHVGGGARRGGATWDWGRVVVGWVFGGRVVLAGKRGRGRCWLGGGVLGGVGSWLAGMVTGGNWGA